MKLPSKIIHSGKLLLWCVLLLCGVGLNAADGKELYTRKNCHTCHGIQGRKPIADFYPILAGQNKEYLIRQTIDIRDGKRKNGLSPAMRSVTGAITDSEIEAISEYLSGLKR